MRHAFSMGNARQEFSGTVDVPLAPEGEQAVRDYRAQGVYARDCATQRYYSSPLTRCLQTFHLAFDGVAELDGVIEAFHEIDFGELEGATMGPEEVRAFFARWTAGEPEPLAPHLEIYVHLRDRGVGAVRDLALRCAGEGVDSVTVVTHSAISRAILGGMAGLPADSWLYIPMPNALGYALELEADAAADPADPAAVRLVRATPFGPDAAERPTIEPQA